MSPAYVYIRWSSLKQEKGDSKERQLQACISHCTRRGWQLAEDPFGDFGVSAWKGDHLKSGKLGKFADRVRSGEIAPGSILVVEELDRLSRQEPRTTQRWMEDMTDMGLRIASVSGDRIYDQASLANSIFETFELLMKAKIANDMVETLSTRLKGSWVRRREEAGRKVVISAHAPGWLRVVGDRHDPDRRFEPIPERVAVVQDIYQMAADGMGARSIARTLNERSIPSFGVGQARHNRQERPGWEHTYVGDILTSPSVEGDYTPGTGRKSYKNLTGERVIGYFPRVVNADLVSRARAGVLSRRGKGGRGRDRCANLFAGLAKCAECGGPMTLVGNAAKPNRYLQCISASRGKRCTQRKLFAYKPFEANALDAMLPLALDDRYFQRPDATNSLLIQLADLTRTLAMKRDAAKGLARQLATKDDPILREVFDEASADVATMQRQVEELDDGLRIARGSVGPQEHARRVLEVRGALEHPDPETRLTARRKVAAALQNVVTLVSCDLADSFQPAGFIGPPWPQKTLTLIMVGGVHALKFDNAGTLLAEASLGEQVPSDPQLRRGLTGGDPKAEAAMDAYLRRLRA